MATTTHQKDKEPKKEEDEKVTRSGIPKDWIAPNILISAQIKFCDMKM